MIERFNFYESHPIGKGDTVTPPPEPDLLSIDADLKGVILTTYLAQHYFRASPNQGMGASIVMTASCGGLYPSFYSPLYSSAKCEFPLSSGIFDISFYSFGFNLRYVLVRSQVHC